MPNLSRKFLKTNGQYSLILKWDGMFSLQRKGSALYHVYISLRLLIALALCKNARKGGVCVRSASRRDIYSASFRFINVNESKIKSACQLIGHSLL